MESPTTHNQNAIITGACFIAATVAAIIGLNFYSPILNNADSLPAALANSNQIALGATFELILIVAIIGTAIMLFPVLKQFSVSWALAYVCFRLLEVAFILVGIISLLSILTLSKGYGSNSTSEIAFLQTAANTLKAIHSWSFILGPHFMLGINTFIYSVIFYKSGLVPRNLSSLGITGAVLVFIGAILELLGILPHFSTPIIILALPIAVYEMVLAVWLIVKGFNIEALVVKSVN